MRRKRSGYVEKLGICKLQCIRDRVLFLHTEDHFIPVDN
jgi:hypothetical protein